MAEAQTDQQASESQAGGASNGKAGASASELVGAELGALVDRLEERVKQLAAENGQIALDDGRRRIQENPITAVLIALGLGFLFGLILGGRRG